MCQAKMPPFPRISTNLHERLVQSLVQNRLERIVTPSLPFQKHLNNFKHFTGDTGIVVNKRDPR